MCVYLFIYSTPTLRPSGTTINELKVLTNGSSCPKHLDSCTLALTYSICALTSYPCGAKKSLHRCNHVEIRVYGVKSKPNASIWDTVIVSVKSATVKWLTAAHVRPFNIVSKWPNASSKLAFFASSSGAPVNTVGIYKQHEQIKYIIIRNLLAAWHLNVNINYKILK